LNFFCPNFALIPQKLKSADNLTLTQPKAAALARYADLVGVSPEGFLERFLEEFLLARMKLAKRNAAAVTEPTTLLRFIRPQRVLTWSALPCATRDRSSEPAVDAGWC
jgi:hypothetical protein